MTLYTFCWSILLYSRRPYLVLPDPWSIFISSKPFAKVDRTCSKLSYRRLVEMWRRVIHFREFKYKAVSGKQCWGLEGTVGMVPSRPPVATVSYQTRAFKKGILLFQVYPLPSVGDGRMDSMSQFHCQWRPVISSSWRCRTASAHHSGSHGMSCMTHTCFFISTFTLIVNHIASVSP